jgi:diadenosine tetraphosphatase ApaH/serine/threonine PP2A family protein phosphatase
MRYLVLTDVHANFEALTAVLDDAGDYDAVLCLGDLIGYGPNPNECVQRVRELPNLTCLVGNHDLAALGGIDLSSFNPFAREAAKWTAEQLAPEVREYLQQLEPARLEGHEFALAHASPRDPIWEYMEAEPQGPPNFKMFQAAVCFVGHTHVPRVFLEMRKGDSVFANIVMPDAGDEMELKNGARKIVNPGGVGQPRNGDPRAAYGIWDTDSDIFTFKRVPYPVEVTQIKIRLAGLPIGLAQRLQFGI